MANQNPLSRRRLLTLGVVGALALGCCGLPLTYFWGNPLERVRTPAPLASVELALRGWPPSHHHAEGRGELVFWEHPDLEVYQIDPHLTRVRRVPAAADATAEFQYVSAFPTSPFAALTGTPHAVLIVSTETGQVRRTIPLPDEAGPALVSPDERWLAVGLSKTEVREYRDPQTGATSRSVTGGPGPRALIDLATGDLVRQVDANNGAAVREMMKPWDVGLGWPADPPGLDRNVSATALNPRTGDYLTGYSRLSFTLWSRLGGAVRVWNARGDRLATFIAHRDTEWPGVRWMTVSADGKYLVTYGEDTLRVWDYQAVSGSGN